MHCLRCFIMQYSMFIQVKVYRILHISKYIDLNANAVKCKIQPWCHLVLHPAIKIQMYSFIFIHFLTQKSRNQWQFQEKTCRSKDRTFEIPMPQTTQNTSCASIEYKLMFRLQHVHQKKKKERDFTVFRDHAYREFKGKRRANDFRTLFHLAIGLTKVFPTKFIQMKWF